MPTFILIGGADDWTPAQACEQMVAGASGGPGAPVSIVVYPGAYHGFDEGMTASADGSRRVHLGTDPAARADALRRVPEWLSRQ